MMVKRHVKAGDEIVVISGKWKGEKGKILAVLPRKDRVVLELSGLSPEKQRQVGRRTLRKRQDRPQGGLIERAISAHVSNVAKRRENVDAAASAPAKASRKQETKPSEGSAEA
jgi:large subunit ribosomal protein L24